MKRKCVVKTKKHYMGPSLKRVYYIGNDVVAFGLFVLDTTDDRTVLGTWFLCCSEGEYNS